MNTISISIIIATYNAERYLQRCLDSIRQQRTKGVEVIVIDGLSQDSTCDIINKNRDIINYFKSESDKGVYDAWNKAIEIAHGQYVMFLGADDMLLPGAITEYLKLIAVHEIAEFDIISSKIDLVDESGYHRRYIGELFNYNNYCRRKLSFAHPGMLHSKAIFEKFGQFSLQYKICSDAEYFIKHGAHFHSAFIDYTTVRMQQGGMSVSFSAILEAYQIRKSYKVISPIDNLMGLVEISILLTLSKLKGKIHLLFS